MAEHPVTLEQAEEIAEAFGSKPTTPSGFSVVQEDIVEQTRWGTVYEKVVFQESTGRYFRLTHEKGSTEYQEDEELDQDSVDEVFPHQVTTTVYRTTPQE